MLKEHGINISMDGKGGWMDNVFIERLWRMLKKECGYLHVFDDGLQSRTHIGARLSHDNQTRPHSKFDGETPDAMDHRTLPQSSDPEGGKQAA